MNVLRDFELLKTNELLITRHKWFFPYYELTDGQFVYARVSHKGSFRRHAVIETTQGTWTIKRKGGLNRTSLINKGEDETIGTLVPETWKRNFNLNMDDGFEAVYMYKKFFSKTFTLVHEVYGDILQIERRLFGIKSPYEVTYNQLQINNMPPIPLLILVGVNLMLIRQARAAH